MGSTGALLLARFFPSVFFLQLWVMGHGDIPRSVFSLGRTRVSAFSLSFLWLADPFGATSLVVDYQAVDCFCAVVLALKSLFACIFSLARWFARHSPLESGVLWCLHVALDAFVLVYT